jgi:hypothetical protein
MILARLTSPSDRTETEIPADLVAPIVQPRGIYGGLILSDDRFEAFPITHLRTLCERANNMTPCAGIPSLPRSASDGGCHGNLKIRVVALNRNMNDLSSSGS